MLNSLVITGILFIAVLGLDVLMGFAGQVSLGQAGFMAIGGYTAAILATELRLAAACSASLAGMALSLVCALRAVARHRAAARAFSGAGDLAFGLMVDSLTVGLTDVTGGPSGLVGIPVLLDRGLRLRYAAADVLSRRRVDRRAGGDAARRACARASAARSKAVRTDQTAAAALGVNVPRYKMAAVCISAALASLSGSLYAFYFHFLSPEMVGTPRSFEMIAMLVAGGEGTLVGPLLGVALLTLLPTIFQPFALYKTFAEGAVAGALLPVAAGRHVRLARRLARAGLRATRRPRCAAEAVAP